MSLVFFLLARSSTAQFNAYPSCVQPLLYKAFPASCLSLTLAAQNTCLCKDVNAFGVDFVTTIYNQCGCADLDETTQLTEAYCSQVGVDVGPALGVFIQDNTNCEDSSSFGASTGISVATVTVGSGSTTTAGSGATVTVTGGGPSAGTGSAKSSDANKELALGQIVEIIVAVAGGIFTLW